MYKFKHCVLRTLYTHSYGKDFLGWRVLSFKILCFLPLPFNSCFVPRKESQPPWAVLPSLAQDYLVSSHSTCQSQHVHLKARTAIYLHLNLFFSNSPFSTSLVTRRVNIQRRSILRDY